MIFPWGLANWLAAVPVAEVPFACQTDQLLPSIPGQPHKIIWLRPWLHQCRYEQESATWSDSPTKHPGSGQLAGPCWGQQRSSPASYRARGCFVTILLQEMPLKAEHQSVHAACWKESGSTITWNLVMWYRVHSPQFWALGHSEWLLGCQFSKLTNCRPFWVEKQKVLHHKDQCPGNCPVPTWP